MFDQQFLDRNLMQRFEISGFDIEIKLEEERLSPIITGHVYVEAVFYFSATVLVTYRIVISGGEGGCSSTKPLNSNQVIILAGMPLGVEHWHPVAQTEGTAKSVIDFEANRCTVKNLHFDREGEVLDEPVQLSGRNEVIHEVFSRYRAFLGSHGNQSDLSYDSSYVLIDVWEDIDHNESIDFSSMSAPEIIEHIEDKHQSELMGLLTLYPYEWPYRDAKYFKRVCGDNIAIDTDDLVLASDNAALILGTYGLRGAESPTNWQEILKRRSTDHVCWPEYLRMLEIVTAKLHTIRSSFYDLQAVNVDADHLDKKEMIRANSLLAINLGRMIIDMNAVGFSRYASHKLMYKKTQDALGVADELSTLVAALNQVDVAMKTVDAMDEERRSRVIRILLAFITIASIFQVIFEPLEIPFVSRIVDRYTAETVGFFVISTVVVGLLLMGAALIGSLTWRLLLPKYRARRTTGR